MKEEELKKKTKKNTSNKKVANSKKKTTTKKKATTQKKKTTTKKKTTAAKKTTATNKRTTTPKKKTTSKKKQSSNKVVTKKEVIPSNDITSNIEPTEITKILPIVNEPVDKVTPKKKKKEITLNEDQKILVYQLVIFCIIFTLFNLGLYFYSSPIPSVTRTYLDESNKVNIDFKINKFKLRNNIYCYYSEKDTIDGAKWKKTDGKSCVFRLHNKPYYTYLKNEDGLILRVDTSKLGRVTKLEAESNKIYLPLNGNKKINLKYEKIGYVLEKYNYYTLDKKIAAFDNGIIKGISKGNTTVYAELMDKKVAIEVVVTDLITSRKQGGFDYNKPYLTCNKYSSEDNILLDEILKDKIELVGYKTRAGVVEAARFLTLDFPYRINYFYENGRQTTNNVDGEGRYYHKGLYLSAPKYKSITGTSKGPKIWGCSLYSRPDHKSSPNGLDCSGFVSWALLNGGFDVKDVGAGWSDNLDLTDYGDVKKIDSSLIKSNKIKVGDLLHSTRLGGHIGIIVGLDNENYYVAQAIWYDEVGLVVSKYKKEKLYSEFPHVVLMDKYYKNDGNLTNMW